jgi:hypothetical protein
MLSTTLLLALLGCT